MALASAFVQLSRARCAAENAITRLEPALVAAVIWEVVVPLVFFRLLKAALSDLTRSSPSTVTLSLASELTSAIGHGSPVKSSSVKVAARSLLYSATASKIRAARFMVRPSHEPGGHR